MRIGRQWLPIAMAAAMALLTALFIKANDRVSTDHTRFLAALRELRGTDAALTLDVLASRFGLNSSYDRLADEQHVMADTLSALRIPAFVDAHPRDELASHLEAYRGLLERKQQLVERFKTSNAVLRNSMAYFPGAVGAIQQKIAWKSSAKEADAAMDDLLQSVLLYLQTGEEHRRSRAEMVIRQIDTGRIAFPESVDRAALKNVLAHARMLLRIKPEVDDLIREISSLPIRAANEQIMVAYGHEYQSVQEDANGYRLALYAAGLALALYALYVGLRLRSTADALAQSNTELARHLDEQRTVEKALRASESRYRQLFESAADGVLVVNIEPDGTIGRFLDANEVICHRLGYSREEMLQMTPREIDTEASRARVSSVAGRIRSEGKLIFEADHLTKDGRHIPVEISSHLFDNGGSPAILSIVRDITQRRQDEETRRLYAEVFRHSAEGIIITDTHNRIVAVNDAFCLITGYSRDQVLGGSPNLLKSGRQGEDFYARMWADIQSRGQWSGEIWNRRRDGEVYPEWLSISSVRNELDQLTHYIAIFTDISERKRIENRLLHMAHHDSLTGLPNRVLLQDRLAHAIAQSRRDPQRRVAVMFVDLDRFKNINDTLGHDFGDAVLREISSRLRALVREEDTVSRQGGDEFVVILSQIAHPEDAGHVAQKITESLNQPFVVDGQELTVTSSIGISVFPEDGDSAQLLMRNADAAMYRAKSEGRNTFRYYQAEMNAASLENLLMENRLRQAILRDELRIHYQPQYDVKRGCISGIEALVRWQSPDFGMVMPSRFIPIAEESGLIVPIGEWVLRTACIQAKAWIDAGLPPLRLAVNLSGRQFADEGLIATVAAALKESQLPPDQLELELTESMLMRDIDRGRVALEQLKALGLHLAVDDFGTGYSSLAYLQAFPLDRVKIDRSFVIGVAHREEDQTIARAIIVLAHALGLDVVAEGVEEQAQLQRLEALGCDLIQGFYIGRPSPPDECEQALLNPPLPWREMTD